MKLPGDVSNYCMTCGCPALDHLDDRRGRMPCIGIKGEIGDSESCKCANLKRYPVNARGVPYEP